MTSTTPYKDWIVIGFGGHARVVADTLIQLGHWPIGFTDSNLAYQGQHWRGIPYLGDDAVLAHFAPDRTVLAMGIGSLPNHAQQRRHSIQTLLQQGYELPAIVHPNAYVAYDVHLAAACQIMAAAIVQPGCRIGLGCIVNSGACIEHDCRIGDHCHIACKATLCGQVTLDDRVHIGAQACVIQEMGIGADTVIAAGACVNQPIAAGQWVKPAPVMLEAHRSRSV